MTARRKGALLTGSCLGGAVVVWAVAFHMDAATAVDGRLLEAFRGAGHPQLGALDPARVQALVDPKPFVLAAEALLAVALVTRGISVASAVGAILLCANATSQLLKPALAEPRGWSVDASAWPSGHATAAMTLALCCLLLAPRRWRPVAAVGGAAFALAVGGSILAEGVHFPSDVLGGYLIAGFWTGLAVVALDLHAALRPATARLRLVARRTAVPAGAAIAAGVVGWRTGDVSQFVVDNTKFAVVAGAIAVSAAAGLAASRSPRRSAVS